MPMSPLLQKQTIFAVNVSQLIAYINNCGLKCTLGEVWRTPEQAKLNEDSGKGISNSLHLDRLAIDINLFLPSGKYITDSTAYKNVGLYWKSLHMLNRWGGDFKKPDGNHFSMMHDGRQ